MKIVVADDDREIAQLIKIYLNNDGYEVLLAYDGEECLKLFQEHEDISLFVLDIMMPKMDGIEVCKRIRTKSQVPIIFLTAKTADEDKIDGFYIGGDDYVTKPFNPLEVLARVKSQLKKYELIKNASTTPQKQKVISIKNITIDLKSHEVHKDSGELVNLTPIEFKILSFLCQNPNQVFSAEDIFYEVWSEKAYEVNNTVMVHIRRLREKIEYVPKNPEIIKTVWGVGYKVEL